MKEVFLIAFQDDSPMCQHFRLISLKVISETDESEVLVEMFSGVYLIRFSTDSVTEEVTIVSKRKIRTFQARFPHKNMICRVICLEDTNESDCKKVVINPRGTYQFELVELQTDGDFNTCNFSSSTQLETKIF